MQKRLSIECLNEKQKAIYDKVVKSPIKVMQIGEGNFLTSFFDWMIYKAIEAGKYEGSIALTCPLNFDQKINILKDQDMLYTVTQRGFSNNVEVDESDIISVFSKVFNYNIDWNSFMEIAELESLEVVISNTTEAGLAYKEVELDKVSVDGLYPGKLTAFLMHRFESIKDKTKKLLIFPCELVDDNGKALEEMVKKHTKTDNNVIITDLRDVSPIYTGNRFLIYSLYPEQNVSIWIVDGKQKQNVSVACGYSILNRSCNVDIGSLMLKFGGGGHKMVGTCQVVYDDADTAITEITKALIGN